MSHIALSHYTPQENTCKNCQQASFRKGRGRLLLLLLLFFLLSFPAFPQSAGRQVTGRVTDAKTGKGVSYVTCKTLGERDSLMAYALTDGTGAFTLTLPDGAEAVEFTLMGYDKISRETLFLYYHFSPLIFDPAQKILYNRLS